MPNDQYGRPVAVGDTVTIKGSLVHVSPDPNFLNCTVKLAVLLPPSGTETTLQLNTAQLEKASGGTPPKPPNEGPIRPHEKPNEKTPPPPPPPPPKEPPPKERKEK
jgi:hypothetical protein